MVTGLPRLSFKEKVYKYLFIKQTQIQTKDIAIAHKFSHLMFGYSDPEHSL